MNDRFYLVGAPLMILAAALFVPLAVRMVTDVHETRAIEARGCRAELEGLYMARPKLRALVMPMAACEVELAAVREVVAFQAARGERP